MITRIVKAKIKSENLKEFKDFIALFLKDVRTFKNCHHADCFADMDEEFQFHMYTIWITEGALNKFRKSETNLKFKEKLTQWCEKPYSAWTVENV